MALVSYDYSSNSENEEESHDSVVLNHTNVKKDINVKITENTNCYIKCSSEINLLSYLPQAKASFSDSFSIENDKLEDFIPTIKIIKEKKKVQICIPSLSEFDDPLDTGPPRKRVKLSDKGSGLLGLLPPVKSSPLSTTSFIPNTVKSKNIPLKTGGSKSLVPHSIKNNVNIINKHQTLIKEIKSGSDSENDDDINTPATFDDQMWEKVCGRPKPKIKVQTGQTLEETKREIPIINIAPELQEPYNGLDNQAFKQLVGTCKRPIGNIKLIDINEEEILPDKNVWMTKSLTDPDMAPKAPIEDPVDPTKRRKHHITYLAQQAKANEQELKAAWATSKSNRMMSRSKYGF